MANIAKNGILSSSEHEVTEFREGRHEVRTLDFNEADFD